MGEQGLPKHREPESLPELTDRTYLESFPYPFLHCLRRAFARSKEEPGRPISPVANGENPADDPSIAAMMSDATHLLLHSDCDGYYLPIDFPSVLVDDRLPGKMLGSSVRLRQELVEVAPYLGIQLEDGHLPDSVVAQIGAAIEAEDDFWIEKGVWLTLFEKARLSEEHKTAMVFS